MTRVVITGGAGGIGGAAAVKLRERGARVIALDVTGEGDDVIACDVRDQASVDRAVAAASERLGGIDVLINCAGVGDPQSAGERPGPDAERVIDINLMGAWRVTGAALEDLRAARGRVVNVASGLAHLTVPFATAYCMSKRGLVAYSDALRLEHGDALTVTTIYPGYIKTPIHQSSIDKGMGLDGLVPEEPLSGAADALVRAALDKPVRDLATSRRGTASYAALRLIPRRLLDRAVTRQLTTAARKGRMNGIAADLGARLR